MIPNKEEIRQLAQTLFYEDNPQAQSITPEDNELRESGYWNQAQNELMRSEGHEFLTYLEQQANELGYELQKVNPSELAKQIKPYDFKVDVDEALKTGIYVSGTSGVGKSDIAMDISDIMMSKDITVLVVDSSTDWIERSNVPYAYKVNAINDINLNRSTIFDTSELTVLSQREFIEKLCALIWRHQVTVKPRKQMFLWFEEAHVVFPLGAFRSKKYSESVRLVTVGRNVDVRIGIVTQFSSMVSKDVMKYMRQRYFGFSSEPNDIDYISDFIGRQKAKELRSLENGQFLYSYNGETKLIAIKPHRQNLKPQILRLEPRQIRSQAQAQSEAITEIDTVAGIAIGILSLIGLTWIVQSVLM